MEQELRQLLGVSLYLRAEHQTLLANFVSMDIELAFTFLDTVRITADPDRAHSAIQHAIAALAAIRYFAKRIEDQSTFHVIRTRADELEAALIAIQFRDRTRGIRTVEG